jgi:hypothetical protein
VHSVPVDVIPVALDLATRRHVSGIFATNSQGSNPWDHVPALLTGQMALAEMSAATRWGPGDGTVRAR